MKRSFQDSQEQQSRVSLDGGPKSAKPDEIAIKEELKSILEAVQREKKVIQEEFQIMNDKIHKYQQLYKSMAKESAAESSRSRTKQETIIYNQLESTLQQMNIDSRAVLDPEYIFGSNTQEADGRRPIDKKQIIKMQKVIVERLLAKLKQQSEKLPRRNN